MADITNLTQFLTDVATAIKSKTGKEELIPAENFDTEILNIETGGKINNQDKEIITNGIFTADDGYTGLGTVTVNVPQEGYDTSDATATENDIRINTSAYIASGKVNGTLDFTGFDDYNNCDDLADILLGEQPYTKLNYIQSNGQQFIDTNIQITDNDKVIITVSDILADDRPILSATTDWATNRFMLSYFRNAFHWYYGGEITHSTEGTSKHTIEIYRGYFKVDDTIVSSNTDNKNVPNKTYLKLFGQAINDRLQSMKFYDLQLYRNNILISHIIPCKDKVTSEAYLVDILSNKIYKNKTAVPFISGDVIEEV